LRQRKRQRRRFLEELQSQLRELGRLAPHRTVPDQGEPLRNALLYSSDEEIQRLESTVGRACGVTVPISIAPAAVIDAGRLETQHDLAPFDAMVFAAIRAELVANASEPKCFVTKNSRDFDVPALHADLASLNCKLLFRFTDALGWIQHAQSNSP
jgi:hypothetical protein